MLFPIGDDNSDRRLFPVVNYLIILANVFVFVLLQGLGANDRFTYAFSTVPKEIITGEDVITQDRVLYDPVTEQKFQVPGL
jgi:membrane associated rhomboid family serine protease